MTILNDGAKITVPVGYNKSVQEFSIAASSSEIEYGYIDANGDFQKLDLSGETPVNSGEPVALENAGLYKIVGDEADYTKDWVKPEPAPEEPEPAPEEPEPDPEEPEPDPEEPEPDPEEPEDPEELVDPPADIPADDFLTLTANKAGSTVSSHKYLDPFTEGLLYRTDKTAKFAKYTVGQPVVLANAGDYVQFWNCADKLNSTYVNGVGTSSHHTFRFVMTGSISASGKLQSMLNFSEIKERCFIGLFRQCEALTTAPELSAETLAVGCYAFLFEGCPNLQSVDIKATSIASFSNCMLALVKNCTSLTSIKVRFTKWNEKNISTSASETVRWVENVADEGTFYKPAALPEFYGDSFIPEGWTVVNIDE
ncbi:MAG: hypothetical protein IKC94_01255 [Lentisphaeria bacterium]|nr:hypothetical protein [Lentisphaeria bacterium]